MPIQEEEERRLQSRILKDSFKIEVGFKTHQSAAVVS
jgi:hypothetical protein